MSATYIKELGHGTAAKNTSPFNFTSVTLSLSALPAAGNTVSVFLAVGGSTITSDSDWTVSDTQGNTYRLANATYNTTGLTCFLHAQTDQNAGTLVSGNTITITIGNSHHFDCYCYWIEEFSGLYVPWPSVNGLDVRATNTANAATSCSTGTTGGSGVTNSLVQAMVSVNIDETITKPAAMTAFTTGSQSVTNSHSLNAVAGFPTYFLSSTKGQTFAGTYTFGSAYAAAGIDEFYASLFAVTYNGNNNTGGSAPGTVNQQETVSVTVLGNTGSLTRTGFTFNTWNTAANGTGTTRAPSSTFTMPASAVTLYAQWIYSSTLAATSGSETASIIRLPSRILSLSGVNSSSLVKLPIRIFSSSGGDSPRLVRQPNKVLSSSGGDTSTISRFPSKVISVTGISSVVKILFPTRTLSVTAISSTVKNLIPQRILSVSDSSASFIVKQPNHILAVSDSGVATESTFPAKVLSSSGVSIAFLSNLPTKILSAIASNATTISRNIANTFSASGSSVVTKILSPSSILFVSASSLVSLIRSVLSSFSIEANAVTTKQALPSRILFVGGTSIPVSNLIPQKILTSLGITDVELSSSVAKVLLAVAIAIPSYIKVIHRTLRGFFTAAMRRDGYVRTYVTRIRHTELNVPDSSSISHATSVRPDEDTDVDGYSTNIEI